MLGWLADLFRLFWGLTYWNIRKSWFRLRRGRSPCPCQSPSDSGRALETHCEACVQWHRPARFHRVCPLLVATPAGLRCAANTPDVRPFWGGAARYYGGALLALYLAGAIGVFAFLRVVGYPISIVHVTWPGLWYRVPQARGWFFLQRSHRAFAAGQTAEGLLYLENAYEFDPANYRTGLALAQSYQVGQPGHSDQIFARLLRDHPAERDATAQDWLRALLARGNFARAATLARDETAADAAHANAWIRALLFATRQSGDDRPLRELLANPSPAALPWRQLVATELLVRAGRASEARAAVLSAWPAAAPRFTIVYRVGVLITLRDPFAAVDLLDSNRLALRDDEAWETLRLDAFATSGAEATLRNEVEALITPPLNLPVNLPRLKILCAQLIRHPNAPLFGRLYDKAERDGLRLNSDTAGIWFSLLCTAGAVGDIARLHGLADRLRNASATPFVAPMLVEAFFRGQIADRPITTVLPLLPMPLEVTYALLERYPAPSSAPRAPTAK